MESENFTSLLSLNPYNNPRSYLNYKLYIQITDLCKSVIINKQ